MDKTKIGQESDKPKDQPPSTAPTQAPAAVDAKQIQRMIDWLEDRESIERIKADDRRKGWWG